jgi:diguanylate cyclase (GGDEF)-like protein
LLHSTRADGSLFWNQLYIAPVRDESGAITHHISVLNDVTELVESRDRLHMQARSDALTSLPNRAVLREWIERAVRHAQPGEVAFAILFMDIDHFKDVNDTLGHRAGDGLLQHVARELRTCVGPDDLVVRYGGDEFVLAVAKPETDDRLKGVLSLIHTCLKEPVSLENVLVHVQMSLGIACFPDDGHDVETLLRHADLAMYRAKASGPNAIQRFDLSFAQAAQVRTTLSRRMRIALESGGFKLVYQPQVDIQLNRITGVEALIRWHDAELGHVNPASFIPVAEENGLIGPIGQWVLEQACVQARAWQQVMPGLRMSVNVSPLQFVRGDFLQVVQRALAGAGLPSRLLELEITESVLVAPGATEVLKDLRELGVGIAIDDFGAGYSSLSYLRTFHADRLKIDMSFVRGISLNREDEAIITAILAMGRSLGLSVVAEGVETATQLSFLVDLGCDFVQGYYFAKPMPARHAMTYMAGFKTPLNDSAKPAAEVGEEPVVGFDVNRSGARRS